MNGAKARRGMVLFTVLWAIAFCSVLAMAASMTFRGLAGIMTIDREREQAAALLSAGLEAGAGIAGALGDAPLTERETRITLSTGSVRVHLSDEGGRIDVGKAPIEVLASLLRYVGAEDDDAETVSRGIIDQRLAEQRLASDGEPKQRTPAAKPDSASTAAAATSFTDIRQIATVPGMRPEWMSAMVPLITVYGSDTINPLTAPVAVIRALPNFDETRLEALLDARRSPLADSERLSFLLGPAQKYLKAQPKHVIGVDIVASTANGYKAAAQAFIVLLPDDKQPYRVLAWNPAVPAIRTNLQLAWGSR